MLWSCEGVLLGGILGHPSHTSGNQLWLSRRFQAIGTVTACGKRLSTRTAESYPKVSKDILNHFDSSNKPHIIPKSYLLSIVSFYLNFVLAKFIVCFMFQAELLDHVRDRTRNNAMHASKKSFRQSWVESSTSIVGKRFIRRPVRVHTASLAVPILGDASFF